MSKVLDKILKKKKKKPPLIYNEQKKSLSSHRIKKRGVPINQRTGDVYNPRQTVR